MHIKEGQSNKVIIEKIESIISGYATKTRPAMSNILKYFYA